MVSRWTAGMLAEVLLLDELELGIGEVRIAQVAVGGRIQFVDEVQRVFYHIFFEVGWILRFQVEFREVYMTNGANRIR